MSTPTLPKALHLDSRVPEWIYRLAELFTAIAPELIEIACLVLGNE
jgi:hypothetical protein